MATEADRLQSLRDSFVNSFTAGELGMSLVVKGYGEVTSAVNPNVGSIQYFFDVAQALDRRGLIDDVFFQGLTQERPSLEGIIRVLWEA